MELAIEVRRLVSKLPTRERAAIVEQLLRAVTSIATNIAEGAGRIDRGDYRRFISIARGSLSETMTLLELAVRMTYVTEVEAARAMSLGTEVGNMLTALGKALTIQKIRGRRTRGTKA